MEVKKTFECKYFLLVVLQQGAFFNFVPHWISFFYTDRALSVPTPVHCAVHAPDHNAIYKIWWNVNIWSVGWLPWRRLSPHGDVGLLLPWRGPARPARPGGHSSSGAYSQIRLGEGGGVGDGGKLWICGGCEYNLAKGANNVDQNLFWSLPQGI